MLVYKKCSLKAVQVGYITGKAFHVFKSLLRNIHLKILYCMSAACIKQFLYKPCFVHLCQLKV